MLKAEIKTGFGQHLPLCGNCCSYQVVEKVVYVDRPVEKVSLRRVHGLGRSTGVELICLQYAAS